MARLCTEILPTGSQCQQFALRSRPWCQVHADETQRARTAHSCQLVAKIPAMDLFETAITLLETTFQVQHKYLPPLHAYAIFHAAATRLDQLAEETWVARERARVVADRLPQAQAACPVNPNQNKRLQNSPME